MLGQDLIRRFCPNEGFGIFVVHIDVLTNGRFQFFYAAEHAAANSLVGEFSKPALHQVDPGSISGGKVDMKAWTFGKPIPDEGSFVGSVVIHNNVHVQFGRHLRLITRPVHSLALESTPTSS